jgi:enoyl-CoA hydratase
MTDSPIVRYELADSIAVITMDDGKANVMSERMQEELNRALDRAEADAAVVLLTGRGRIFSGGYDMGMFARSREEIMRTLRTGGSLVARILDFPRPVVAACNGSAIAQGAFLLLACDARIGAVGEFKIGLNEVVNGLTIPYYGVEVARFRLSPSWFNHSTLTGALYPPNDALAAGFLDRLVDHADVLAVAREEARRLTTIDVTAHVGTKKRVRGRVTALLREGVDAEFPAA